MRLLCVAFVIASAAFLLTIVGESPASGCSPDSSNELQYGRETEYQKQDRRNCLYYSILLGVIATLFCSFQLFNFPFNLSLMLAHVRVSHLNSAP